MREELNKIDFNSLPVVSREIRIPLVIVKDIVATILDEAADQINERQGELLIKENLISL